MVRPTLSWIYMNHLLFSLCNNISKILSDVCWIRGFVTLKLSLHIGQVLILVSNKHNEQMKWLLEQAYILLGDAIISKQIGHSNSLRSFLKSSLSHFSLDALFSLVSFLISESSFFPWVFLIFLKLEQICFLYTSKLA